MKVERPITNRQKEFLKTLRPSLRTDNMTCFEAYRMIGLVTKYDAVKRRLDFIKENDLHVGDIVTDGNDTLTIKIISPTGYVTFKEKQRHWNPINLRRIEK